jgi:CRP-like cAMP-binding protein
MATRVALHPFLAGMKQTQLALLTDCAMAAHFTPGQVVLRKGELANRFYLVESGKVVVESAENFGEPLVVEAISAGRPAGLVLDVSALRLAFHRARCRANGSNLFLRYDPA